MVVGLQPLEKYRKAGAMVKMILPIPMNEVTMNTDDNYATLTAHLEIFTDKKTHLMS